MVKRRSVSHALHFQNQAAQVAADELQFMMDFCENHDANTIVTVARTLTETGVTEGFRIIQPEAAMLEQFAVHGG